MHRVIKLALVLAPALVGNAPVRCQPVCQTLITGGTITNQTWTAAGSPYCVLGNINVSSLSIGPGVTVLLNAGVQINVTVRLTTNGTKNQPILFTERTTGQPWAGFLFQNTSGSVLDHCIIEHANQSGIRIVNSALTIRDCVIRNNWSPGNGGGVDISLASGSLTLTRCEIMDNQSASHGGGVNAIVSAGVLTLDGCSIMRNRANPGSANPGWHVGGGLRAEGHVLLMNCVVSRNESYAVDNCAVEGRAGGIYCNSGNVTMRNCIISRNHVSGYQAAWWCGGGSNTSCLARGGGVYFNYGNGTLTMTNCQVSCNSGGVARNSGGGPIYVSGSGVFVASGATATITNCTLAKNQAHAIENAGGTVNINSSILYFNNGNGAQTMGTVSCTYSDVQGGAPGNGNINFNPGFVGFGCEPTDLVIVPGSPCMDAGDPSLPDSQTCHSPTGGGTLNDMGTHGGPGLCSFQPPTLLYCAGMPYGQVRGGSNTLDLDWIPQPGSPQNLGTVVASGATPGGPGFFLAGLCPGESMLGSMTLLINPACPFLLTRFPFDAQGRLSFAWDLHVPFLAGIPFHLQVVDLTTGSISNGLALLP